MIKVYNCLSCELLSYLPATKKVNHTTNMPKIERETQSKCITKEQKKM